MIAAPHIRPKLALALWLSLSGVGVSAQCGGVRPAFEWYTVAGTMFFNNMSDQGFQWPDSVTWVSASGISANGSSISFQYQTAGIDTVTLNLWYSGCAISTVATVPHGGISDQCLLPVFCSFTSEHTGNNSMAFYDASNTSGQQVLEFWDFGDGVLDLSPDPAHFYPFPGAYDVSHSISTLDSSTLCMAGRAEHIFVDGNASTCDTSLFLSLEVNSFGSPALFDASVVVFNAALEITNTYWEFGDGQVESSSAPNMQHFYAAPGEYQACVNIRAYNTATQDSCSATACQTLLNSAVGFVELPATAMLRAWPLPFSHALNVDGAVVVPGAQWTLFDALGRVMDGGVATSSAALKLNATALPPGPYVLMVRAEGRHAALRIVRE